jgi:HAD superfamily hydrolase (TIGR01490 family)
MAVALFDLDHTLLAGDSDYAWGQFMIEHGLVDGAAYKHANDRYYQQYLEGTLDIHEFVGFALAPMTRVDRATLDRLHAEYMKTCIRPMVARGARALLDKHRARDHTLVIITATNSFVTAPIARELGVEHLIATTPEEHDGRFTGRIAGIPSYREGKVERLKQWLELHGKDLNDSWAYSDSHNDLPLLEAVTHPVAVDPDPKLRAEAAKRRWRTISLR